MRTAIYPHHNIIYEINTEVSVFTADTMIDSRHTFVRVAPAFKEEEEKVLCALVNVEIARVDA